MNTGTFMDLISVNYNKIRSLFRTRLRNMDMRFDEDSFNDAFIKCAQKFGNERITYEYTIKYFWAAYLNTIKANISKEHKLDVVAIDDEMHDKSDEEEDELARSLYKSVMNAIANEFGEDAMMIYSLYKLHDWTEEEISNYGYDCTDLDSCIMEIDKFINTNYKNKHKRNINRIKESK